MSGQLSFFSSVARPASIEDLAGMLCAGGEVSRFGSGEAARIRVPVGEPWRAKALIRECAERGVELEFDGEPEEDGTLRLRTAFRADLAGLAARWLCGAVKSVPEGLHPDGGMLRMWTITSGRRIAAGYVLGLDPDAPHTHEPLSAALRWCGLPAGLIGLRAGAPALRLSGSRRRARLAELVGDPPTSHEWPS